MQSQHHNQRLPQRARLRLVIPVLALLASSLACSLAPAGDATLRETDIALGIQQTLVAQTATALPLRLLTPVQVTPSSPPPTAALPPTTAPSATPPPTDTAAPPTVAPPTAAPVVEATAIPITEWGSYLFVPLSSGCKVAGTKCWKMDDDYRKISIDNNMYLVSKNPVPIDASWSRPALVFWHRYKFESAASIEIRADGVWSTMKILNQMTSGGHWVQEVVDLTMFKGKSVIVRLNAVGLYGAGDWFINDVQIVPNYAP